MDKIQVGYVFALSVVFSSATPDNLQEYCEDETFIAHCSENEVIVMQEARYGRMRIGTCLKTNYGYQGCSKDILPVFDGRCSGRQTCEIDVRDLLLEGQKPCPEDLRSYLEARYTCLTVIKSETTACPASTPVVVREPRGYISNYVTEQTGCGGIGSPWVLRAPSGQHFNITLQDYGALLSQEQHPGIHVCQVLAVIKEKTRGTSETICSGRHREQAIYISSSNEVEIRIVLKANREEQERYFLLQYQSLGCADIPVSANTWFRRTPTGATIGCIGSASDTWELTCKDDKWIGPNSNCSNGPRTANVVMKSIMSLPYGLSVAIMVAIALVIGALVLVVGLVYIKRRRHRQHHPNNTTIPRKYSAKDGYYADPDRQCSDSHQTGINNEALYSTGIGDPKNTYYRTWELQRHPIANSNATSGTMASYPPTRAQEDLPPHYMEHIYESPKSVRRQVEAGNESLQYYELDPQTADVPGSHGTRRARST